MPWISSSFPHGNVLMASWDLGYREFPTPEGLVGFNSTRQMLGLTQLVALDIPNLRMYGGKLPESIASKPVYWSEVQPVPERNLVYNAFPVYGLEVCVCRY